MNESERLADQIHRALVGDAWHGPSWRETLEGVTRAAAVERPIPDAHTIAEIVLHSTTWHDVARLRLLGESPKVSEEENWPGNVIPDDLAWAAVVERLLQTGDELRKTVAAFPAGKLHDLRTGLEDTWYGLILGELQHMLYHAGQIAILRKAVEAK